MTKAAGFTAKIPRPKRNRRLKWLRRIHTWFGLWGAVLGLLFGLSGILLNHRSVMKIPAMKMDESRVELALPIERPKDPDALARWLQSQLNIDRGPSRIALEKSGTVHWGGREIRQPGQWRIDFHRPQTSYRAEYWEGNATVSVKRQEANFFEFLTRLHKGVGLGVAWILLTDTLALSLVFLSLTGLWMWCRTQGSRTAAGLLGLTSLGLIVFVILGSL